MKRYLVTVAVVFCVVSILMYLVMGVLLANDAMALGPVVRPIEEQKVPVILVSNAITALAFVWIFSAGFEAGKPWLGQGLRFGLAAWLFRPLPVFLLNHALMPFPVAFVAKQMVYTLPVLVVVGMTAAYVYHAQS
jgi:hypothetical protein